MERTPGIPTPERLEQGPVACIECVQCIPCNPCEAACPQKAITVGAEITALPKLDGDWCNGCGICITRCPGLAIFRLHKHYTDTTALVSFPYEYVPLPEQGASVRCSSRDGAFVCEGVVSSVRTAPTFDHTAIVTVEIPKEHLMDVRGIQRKGGQ